MASIDQKLRVFLSYAPGDKSAARVLYESLSAEKWIEPWLDEETLLPGQDWRSEIDKAMETTDAVIVLVSRRSVSKEGSLQRRLRYSLDIAQERLGRTIPILPLRLEDVRLPGRLIRFQSLDYFPSSQQQAALQRLLISLKAIKGSSTSLDQQESWEPNSPRPVYRDAPSASLPGDPSTDAPPPIVKKVRAWLDKITGKGES